ncbi:MAG: DUF1961 family protein [Phycisphaeraceae bacterium]|nr:DUF1961 family protein [Phycisphaeraceae bacterium]
MTYTIPESGDLIHENPLQCMDDLHGWIAEGQPVCSFPQGCLRLENGLDASRGQAANYVFWCPEKFPADITATWRFRPLREPGLAMFWLCAAGRNGEDLFDRKLAQRTGEYRQYFDGDINAYHISYFRRKNPDERRFHTCNLRKSHGFHLVCQGGDPIPSVDDVSDFYRITVIRRGPRILLLIDDLPIFDWTDDGRTHGPVLGGGYIGFRQMAPMIGEYADLKVYAAS